MPLGADTLPWPFFVGVGLLVAVMLSPVWLFPLLDRLRRRRRR